MNSKALVDYFAEGLEARQDGKHPNANPYCVGSDERREWAAGFNASVETEDDKALILDPNEGNAVRSSGG